MSEHPKLHTRLCDMLEIEYPILLAGTDPHRDLILDINNRI